MLSGGVVLVWTKAWSGPRWAEDINDFKGNIINVYFLKIKYS